MSQKKKKFHMIILAQRSVLASFSKKKNRKRDILTKKEAIYAFGPFDQNSEDRTTLFTPALHKGLKHNSVLPIFH